MGIAARMYRKHVCVPERNNHGHTVIAFIKKDPAVRLYQQDEVDAITKMTTEVSSRFARWWSKAPGNARNPLELRDEVLQPRPKAHGMSIPQLVVKQRVATLCRSGECPLRKR